MFAANSSLHGMYQLVCNHSLTTRQETVKLELVQHKLETENLCIQSKIVLYHCNPYISESTMFTLKADSLCVWFAYGLQQAVGKCLHTFQRLPCKRFQYSTVHLCASIPPATNLATC